MEPDGHRHKDEGEGGGNGGSGGFPMYSFLLCCPAFIVAFTGGFLISALDATQTQVQISFGFCDDGNTFDCTQGEYNVAYIQTALFVGAIAGALVCRIIAERGRKLLLCSVSFFVIPGSILSGLTPDGNMFGAVNLWYLLIIGRFISGIGMGFVCVSCPLFVGEVTPNAWRGNFNSLQFFMQAFGSFSAVVLSLAVQHPPGDPQYSNSAFDQWWWRVLLLLPVLFTSISLIALSFIYETPYILVKRGKDDIARNFLIRVHGDIVGTKEFESTVFSVGQWEKHAREGTGKPLQLLTGPNGGEYLHALFIGIALGGLQNLSGARSLLTSSSRIFGQAGFSSIDANYLTVGLLGGLLISIYISSVRSDLSPAVSLSLSLSLYVCCVHTTKCWTNGLLSVCACILSLLSALSIHRAGKLCYSLASDLKR